MARSSSTWAYSTAKGFEPRTHYEQYAESYIILNWGLCNRLPVLKKRSEVTFEADRQVIMAKT